MSFAHPYTDDHSLPALEWYQRSREWCREMRENHPLTYHQESGWLVFTYQESAQVFSDYGSYSSEFENVGSISAQQEEARSIIGMDPPRHQHLRSLVTQAFSARRIAQMEPRIQQIAENLLSKISATGQADFMEELAAPLPVIVIAEFLGIAGEDWQLFKRWTDAQVRGVAAQEGTDQALIAYFFKEVEQKRKHPDQSLISLLLRAVVEGESLTNAELYSFFLTLLVAGNVTTTNLLGNAMLCFNLFPPALEQLRHQPELVGSTVEEILRYMPPSRILPHSLIGSRIARKETTLLGQRIEIGDVVRPIILSANFDDRHIADPESFLIDRHPNRHISFGHGIHFCLGAPLARLEARIVLTTMLKHFAHWEILNPEHLQQIDTELIFGVSHLPMSFKQA